MELTYENTIEILKNKKHSADVSSIKYAYYESYKESDNEGWDSKNATNKIRKHLKDGIERGCVERIRYAAGGRSGTFRYVSLEQLQQRAEERAKREELQSLAIGKLIQSFDMNGYDAESMIRGDNVLMTIEQFLSLVP